MLNRQKMHPKMKEIVCGAGAEALAKKTLFLRLPKKDFGSFKPLQVRLEIKKALEKHEIELVDWESACGKPTKPGKRKRGGYMGYCFIELKDPECAKRAIEVLKKAGLAGKPVEPKFCSKKKEDERAQRDVETCHELEFQGRTAKRQRTELLDEPLLWNERRRMELSRVGRRRRGDGWWPGEFNRRHHSSSNNFSGGWGEDPPPWFRQRAMPF